MKKGIQIETDCNQCGQRIVSCPTDALSHNDFNFVNKDNKIYVINKGGESVINNATEINVKDILKTRLWFYDLLGKSFYLEPEISRLKKVCELKIFEQFINNEDFKNEGIGILRDFFDNISKISNEEFNSLRKEYTRLFIGPGHLPAPPWGSVYLSKERIIFDENTLEVRKFYKKWGVNTKNSNKEPDDHIGFELEFISILIDKSLSELDKNNINGFKNILTAQIDFLKSHILIWIDVFSDKLSENTEYSLFKGLALFLPEYLKMDIGLLEDLLENLENLQ